MGNFYRNQYNMGKQYKWEAIMDLEVQDIKGMITFSSKDLVKLKGWLLWVQHCDYSWLI